MAVIAILLQKISLKNSLRVVKSKCHLPYNKNKLLSNAKKDLFKKYNIFKKTRDEKLLKMEGFAKKILDYTILDLRKKLNKGKLNF